MEYFQLSEVKKYADKGPAGAWISDKLLWRPFSIYATWLIVNLRIHSVFIVSFSLICVAVSAIVLFDNSPVSLIWGAIGIEVFAFLDHVDGETARFEMRRRGIANSRVGHFLDLFAHKVSIIAMFAIGWAVANATGNQIYSVLSFMLCFFMLGPVTEPANEIVIEEAKKSDMGEALAKLRAFSVVKYPESKAFRPSEIALFLNEIVGFPGWLHLIVITCLLDAFVAPLALFGQDYFYRELLVIFLTPVYAAKFLYSFRHYLKLMLSIKHD
jgi:hypothetical protein